MLRDVAREPPLDAFHGSHDKGRECAGALPWSHMPSCSHLESSMLAGCARTDRGKEAMRL